MRAGSPLLLLLTLACDAAESPPMAANVAEWSVDPRPLLEIGSAEDDSTDDLYEVSDAVRLSDGTVVIGNRGTHELRFFGPDGALRASAGGRGGGPGEYTSLGPLDVHGDTVYAFDYENQHVNRYDAAGRLLGSTLLAAPDGCFPPRFLAVLPDGRLLTSAQRLLRVGQALLAGIRRDSLAIWVHDAAGTPLHSLGTWPGAEMHVALHGNGGRRGGVSIAYYPFYRTFLAAAGGGRIHLGMTDSARIDGFDTALRPLPPIRWRPGETMPPEDLRERYTDYELAGLQDRSLAPRVRKDIAELPIPERLPEYRAILIDRAGLLWVREFDLPWSTTARWRIYDSAGTQLARLDAPGSMTFTDIGADWILALSRDELGVEHVQLHTIRRR